MRFSISGAGLVRRVRRSWHAGAALALMLPGMQAVAQAPGVDSAVIDRSCDRDCLIGFVDTYLDGLLHKDTSRVPFADDVKFTENNVVMPVGGHGLWANINWISDDNMYVADVEKGKAALFAIVEEHGKPAYYGLRMAVKDGLITEAENVVVRNQGMPMPFADPYSVKHDPAWEEVIPEGERRSRERLIAIANGYFNTVELNDGVLFTPFHDDCGRLENGILTTAAASAQGCAAQLELGIYRINKRIRERLYSVVDVERGIVVASGFFDHANQFDRYNRNDGVEMRTLLKWPNTIMLLEAFKVKDGAIHRIEAIFTYVPYFMHSPWATPGGSGSQ
ncbi:MAG TPA: hypothetical protein GX696_09550 [Pseudomonadaceae bacterium]|nr:hypothetical protein [Pseudomonadaceae bacterium]